MGCTGYRVTRTDLRFLYDCGVWFSPGSHGCSYQQLSATCWWFARNRSGLCRLQHQTVVCPQRLLHQSAASATTSEKHIYYGYYGFKNAAELSAHSTHTTHPRPRGTSDASCERRDNPVNHQSTSRTSSASNSRISWAKLYYLLYWYTISFYG